MPVTVTAVPIPPPVGVIEIVWVPRMVMGTVTVLVPSVMATVRLPAVAPVGTAIDPVPAPVASVVPVPLPCPVPPPVPSLSDDVSAAEGANPVTE